MSDTEYRRICLVGVRGVGKSTLIRSVIDSLPKYEYIIGSAVLRELAGPDFAHFDHLPPDTKQRYREDAIDWMITRQKLVNRHILCDGHTSLLDESTGKVGPVFTNMDCNFFRELILLEASAQTIFERRSKDSSKQRSLDTSIIAAELSGERNTGREIADQWGMRLHILPDGKTSNVRKSLLEVLS